MAHIKPFNTLKKDISLLIVDDHQLVRQGLKKMILSLKSPYVMKLTEAENGEEAIRKINQKEFDMVFMDYQMPGHSGLETIYRILRFKPQQKIIVLSNYDEITFVESVRDAGAKGYLLKNIESPELLKAISSVLAGFTYYSSDITLKLLEAGENSAYQNNVKQNLLTARETEVLTLIAMELKNEEIARRLFISKRTVDTHRRNIKLKLEVKNTAGLTREAIKMKLVG